MRWDVITTAADSWLYRSVTTLKKKTDSDLNFKCLTMKMSSSFWQDLRFYLMNVNCPIYNRQCDRRTLRSISKSSFSLTKNKSWKLPVMLLWSLTPCISVGSHLLCLDLKKMRQRLWKTNVTAPAVDTVTSQVQNLFITYVGCINYSRIWSTGGVKGQIFCFFI